MSSAVRLVRNSDLLAFTCQKISPPANSTATAAAIQALLVELKIIIPFEKIKSKCAGLIQAVHHLLKQGEQRQPNNRGRPFVVFHQSTWPPSSLGGQAM